MTKLTREELLILLMEEAGEVIQAASKCLRFGWGIDHGIGYGRNDKVLAKECGEMAAVMDELPFTPGVRRMAYHDGYVKKIKRAEEAKETYGSGTSKRNRPGQRTVIQSIRDRTGRLKDRKRGKKRIRER